MIRKYVTQGYHSLCGYQYFNKGFFNITKTGLATIFTTSSDAKVSARFSKSGFELHLTHMREMLTKFPGAEVTELVIEEHVAICLFQNGELTADQLKSATCWSRGDRPSHMLINGWIDGLPLRVATGTYYDSWEFHITGHPKGKVKTRPTKDLLAALSGEELL